MPEPEDPITAFREFAEQIVLRFERAMNGLVLEMREERRPVLEEVRLHRAESRSYFERLREGAEQDRRRTDELIAESRARRKALLHILDRLDNGGAAPA